MLLPDQAPEKSECLLVGEEVYPASQYAPHAAELLHPTDEPRLIFRFRWDGDVNPPERIHGHKELGYHHLLVRVLEEILGELAEKGVDDGAFMVKPDNDIGNVVLLDRVTDACSDIQVEAAYRGQVHVRSRRYLRRPLQKLFASHLPSHGVITVVYYVQGHEVVRLLLVAHHEGQTDEALYGVGVDERDEQALFLGSLLLSRGHVVHHDPLGGVLGNERAGHAGDEYQQDSPVQHVLVQQARAVGQDDVVAYEHGGEGGRGLRVAQPEHELALHGLHLEYLLRAPRGYPLAEQGARDHHSGYLERVDVAEQYPKVYHHAYADEEVGDEQRVAHELKVAHQRRDVGYQAIEHQSHKEGAQDALHAYKLHETCAEKHHRQHEDILDDAVAVTAEEPPGDAGKDVHDAPAKQDDLEDEGYPEAARRLAAVHARDDGEHQKRQRVRHGGASHGYAHRALAVDAVPRDDGVGYQRVRGVHAGQQQGGHEGVVEHVKVDPEAYAQRDDEGEDAQDERLDADALEVFHVHLQSREEHDVVESHLSEKLEAAVERQEVQSVLPYGYPRQNHADNVRDAEPLKHDGREQNNRQHEEEYPCRVGDGK